jgi:hypothetical protein
MMVSISKKQIFFYCHVFSNGHNFFFWGAIWRHHIKTFFNDLNMIWFGHDYIFKPCTKGFETHYENPKSQNENALEKFVYPPLNSHTFWSFVLEKCFKPCHVFYSFLTCLFYLASTFITSPRPRSWSKMKHHTIYAQMYW